MAAAAAMIFVVGFGAAIVLALFGIGRFERVNLLKEFESRLKPDEPKAEQQPKAEQPVFILTSKRRIKL